MDGNIDKETTKILDDNECAFYTSTVAVFELLHLIKIGKLRKSKKKNTDIDILSAIKAARINIVSVSEKHFTAYSKLQTLENHKDPNDHLIIAQAISDKIPLISSDTKFEYYIKQGLQLVFNKR